MNRSMARKLRMLAMGSTALVLVAAFQNCGKPANIAQMASQPGGEVLKTSASQFRELVIPEISKQRDLDLNVDSGVIQSSDGQRYCLKTEDLQKVQDILNSSNVCEPPAQDADVVCTAIYRFPYAHLKSSSQDLALGEGHNGCDPGMDLCGEAGVKLRTFVSGVISSLDNMRCN